MLESYESWMLARQYSRQTIEAYTRRIRAFFMEHPDPSEVSDYQVGAYLTKLRDTGISLNYLESHYYALRSFFIYLGIHKKANLKLDLNLLSELRPIRREKRIRKIIPDDDLSEILRAPDLKTLRGCRDYVIMLFLLHGLRAKEICDLTLDQVFTDGRGISRRMVIEVQGKGRKERRVVVESSGDTEWAWKRYANMRKEGNCMSAFPALPGKGKMKPMTPNGLYRMLKRYGDKLGLKKIHPHLWRHTTAARLLEEGVPIQEIQHRLGHESISTTEQYLYAASVQQESAANCPWIHNLRKADGRFRRWR